MGVDDEEGARPFDPEADEGVPVTYFDDASGERSWQVQRERGGWLRVSELLSPGDRTEAVAYLSPSCVASIAKFHADQVEPGSAWRSRRRR